MGILLEQEDVAPAERHYAVIEVAAGGRAWLQPLQFHKLAGGAADSR